MSPINDSSAGSPIRYREVWKKKNNKRYFSNGKLIILSAAVKCLRSTARFPLRTLTFLLFFFFDKKNHRRWHSLRDEGGNFFFFFFFFGRRLPRRRWPRLLYDRSNVGCIFLPIYFIPPLPKLLYRRIPRYDVFYCSVAENLPAERQKLAFRSVDRIGQSDHLVLGSVRRIGHAEIIV